MHKLVPGNCKCGSVHLIATRELKGNVIDGYCPQCYQPFSGFYVPIPPLQSVQSPVPLK
jgi:hypothetical protein